MPKTTRRSGGRENINVPGLDDSPRQPPSAPAEPLGAAQDKATAKNERSPKLYRKRPETFTAKSLGDNQVEVTAQDGSSHEISLGEFEAVFEPLVPPPAAVTRWKLNIHSPQLVPINFCENGEPSPRLISNYIDTMYEVDGEVPAIPGVLISGPAC